MKTVTLDVRAPADSMADFVQAWKTGREHRAAIECRGDPPLTKTLGVATPCQPSTRVKSR